MPMGAANPPLELITFDQALAMAQGHKHLLLGNGFSRALRNDIFAYDALFRRADFSKLDPRVRNTFEALDTSDFEIVMRALRSAARVLAVYKDDPELVKALQDDADALREVLARAIADSHPAGPFEIEAQQYASCRRFLSN